MFPPHGAIIDRNEAGEPTGWDMPEEGPPYCDICGYHHSGECPDPYGDEDEDEDEDEEYEEE